MYTDEYCDAIEYEGLVFAATTRGTVFHGVVVSVRLSCTVMIIVSSTCMRVSKFLLINLLLVFPRSCEYSTTYT